MTNEYPNKREFTRVPVNCHVEIRAGSRAIPCSAITTLSMNGMYVLTHEQLDDGLECEVTITLVEHEVEIELLAQVVRNYPDGIAFQFTKILGAESFGHLRNLVLYNAQDQDVDRLESELDAHAGIRRKES